MFNTNKFLSIKEKIIAVAGIENVRADGASRALYSYDASPSKAKPQAVINVRDRKIVKDIVKICRDGKVPFTARTAGTNLCGACAPLKSGVIINLAPLTKIIEIDTGNDKTLVEPGVINEKLQSALAELGYFFGPDPASQRASAIGGNAALNAGGPHCLKYGVMSNNIVSAKVITADGEEVIFRKDAPGPDMLSLFIGSEGTLGIATEFELKIIKTKKYIKTALACFNYIEDAIAAVSEIIKAGITPCTMEAMDRLTIDAVEKYENAGYPKNCQAVLIIEFDGDNLPALEKEADAAREICFKNKSVLWDIAKDGGHRQKLWKARKGAFAGMARLAPNVFVEDGALSRDKLSEGLKRIREIIDKYGITAGLLFHAGDGNLHPNIIFDERNPAETNKVRKAGYEMLAVCAKLGGTISGEHGIGVEKRAAMKYAYDEETLEVFRKIKKSSDPGNIANPDKIIPVTSERYKKVKTTNMPPAEREIAEMLKERHGRKIKTAVFCNETKINRHLLGGEEFLPLNKLCKITEINDSNFTATIQAGMPVGEMARQLKDKGFRAAMPDISGSLGGAVAVKLFPGISDYILGMTIAMPDGTIAVFGGHTVKNSAGYNVHKFLAGSFGAYAVILNVTLRIFPLSARLEIKPEEIKLFAPDRHHFKLKKSFDEFNLLNPFVFKNFYE